MVTRGITSLLTLPFVLIMLISACWFAARNGGWRFVMAEPDQLVVNFMREVVSEDDAMARTYLGPQAANTSLPLLRGWILGRYGSPLNTVGEVHRVSQNHVILYTYTDTDSGHRYYIRWVLDFEGGRWVINDLQGLHELAPGS